MSESLSDDELLKALDMLEPVAVRLDRDRLMYRAGQTSSKNVTWRWRAISGGLAAAVLALAIVLAHRPGPRTVIVQVPVPFPVPATVENTTAPEPSMAQLLEYDEPVSEPVYFRLERQVLSMGTDALSTPPSTPELPGLPPLAVRPAPSAMSQSPSFWGSWIIRQ